MISHQAAREALAAAFAAEGLAANTGALQIAQAVALGESQYGSGWKGVTPSPHNWGAVQNTACPKCGDECCWPCPPGSFEYPDTHADGRKYQACFVRYPTPAAGARHFVHVLAKNRPGVHKALLAGDVGGVSREMSRTRYMELDQSKHEAGLRYNTAIISRALGERDFGAGGGGGRGGVAVLVFSALALWGVVRWSHDDR